MNRRGAARAAAAVVAAAALVTGCTGHPSGQRSPSGPGSGSPARAFPDSLPTRPPPAPTAVDGSSTPVADPVYPEFGNPDIDIRHYDLALAWSPSSRVLTGTATLTIRILRPVAQITLDFSQAYGIDGASVDGRGVTAGWRGGDLALPAAGTLPAGSTVTAVVSYHGTPRPAAFPGTRSDVPSIGVHVADDGAIWAMQEPYGAYTWFPCSDQPSDKALFDVAITAPAGWAGVASGEPAATTAGGDGSTTRRWHGTAPSATYLVAFAVDRFERFTDTGPHGLPVTYWMRREDADQMLPLARQVPEMIAWLERRFGPYPFTSAGVVIVPDRSAMETQTMITMGQLTGYRGETVLLHELSHQWFGDAVTPATWRDLWLNEGFATYAEMLYATDRLGTDQAATLRLWRDGDPAARRQAGPPGSYDPQHFADRNVYYGPALMLHDIRGRLGDPGFFAVLHDWAQHHRYGTVDRAAFERWLSDTTRRDLTPVIERWLDSSDPAAG